MALCKDRPGAPVEELRLLAAVGEVVLHWYDLTCPFCYLAQPANARLEAAGIEVVELPFQAHPDVPLGGVDMGERRGPMYDHIAQQAQDLGLPLHWQSRLPNSKLALSAAEWVRESQPASFATFQSALFRAHFAGDQDIGEPATIVRLAEQSAVDPVALRAALESGSAFDALARSQAAARRLGVSGTPAWASAGRLLIGLQTPEALARFAAPAARTQEPEGEFAP